MSTLKEHTEQELKEIQEKMTVPTLKKTMIIYPNEISEIFNCLPIDEKTKKELYDEIMEIYRKNPDSEDLKLR